MSRLTGVAVAVLLLLTGPLLLAGPILLAGPANANDRVALVIGNGAYRDVAPLPNPPNDAKAVAQALRRIGFSVVDGYDLTFTQMAERLRAFGRATETASVALVFYAGHGLQVNGHNYFLPVDARVQREQDLSYDALSLDVILEEAEGAKQLRIIILDACRDNPFAARIARAPGATRAIKVTEGLAQVGDIGRNTLVAYATAANALAEDGAGGHSPYTTALLKHIETPGLEINLLFGRIRDSVFDATGGRQTPFTYGSLGGEPFYLIPPPLVQAPVQAPAATPAATLTVALPPPLKVPDPPPVAAPVIESPSEAVAELPLPLRKPMPEQTPEVSIQPAVSTETKVPLAKGSILQKQSPIRAREASGKDPRCANILERAQLGEAISDATKAFLRGNC
ncbi:caspase (peptidase) [Skermanella stibiiresistens SB22]|uniref:Caspase (Peptidase) n=1 Tax=Skermanella stibiiresistens SB22 TaxID=1385369 RepID=W9H6M8_9PROT|nr:caspase family protein [Skermanella stibiiresistens]EWY40446.1 caspase (peptidase) [Skermanella stibiiresistens SB22]